MGRTYICSNCKMEFESGWSEEEAINEMQKNFGNIPEKNRVVVCDDCHRELMEWAIRINNSYGN